MANEKIIAPSQGLAAGSFQAQLCLDVDPEQCPDGLVLTVSKPGIIATVLGEIRIARGAMLMAIDATTAEQFRKQLRPMQGTGAVERVQ